MDQDNVSFANFNWWRELWLLALAGMEVSWLAGYAVILMGVTQTAGLGVAWLSMFGLYGLAAMVARTLIRRRTRRVDWVIGSLVGVSSLAFVKFNVFPDVSVFNPIWLKMLWGHIASEASPALSHDLVALFTGFFIWFRGMRLPARYPGTRAMLRTLQVDLLLIVGLALLSLRSALAIDGLIVTFFVFSMLALAFTRIEETARTEAGAASPFGRQWLFMLLGALLSVGVLVLIITNVLTVKVVRILLSPFVTLAIIVLSAFAFLLGIVAQYMLFPLLARILSRFPTGLFNFQLPEQFEPADAEETVQSLLVNPAFLDALRIVSLFLIALIGLWFVTRSFRRWRMVQVLAGGGMRDRVEAPGSLAEDLLGYLQDRWERLRSLADLRRLFQARGAGSIRIIYANLLVLMGALEHPRRAGQTPYEFEPVADGVLPAREQEISAITAAYVRARYGEQDIDAQELQVLKAAWKAVQSDGEKLLEGKPVLQGTKTSEQYPVNSIQ